MNFHLFFDRFSEAAVPSSCSSRILKSLAISVSAIAISTSAFAQDTSADDSNLDVIVVTAQKREQNLQEVPIAVSAISAAKLEQMQVTNTRDLSGIAPNLTISPSTTNHSAAVISIRGIASGSLESFGLDLANGIYVDGVYIARANVSGMGVMDLERVEVLRGPQGTLFGRNTTGGAISFVSRQPSNDFGIKAEVGYGNFDAWNGKITVNSGSLLGGLKTSFSYAHTERNGIIDNILEPKKSRDPGSRNTDAFRFAALADIGSTGSIQYTYDRAETSGVPLPFQLTNTADGTFNPPQIVNGEPVVVTQQAPVKQYLAAATFLEPGCAALGIPTSAYRKKMCQNSQGVSSETIQGHNLQLKNDFDIFAVKFTGGYRRHSSVNNGSDLDGLGTIRGPMFTSATMFNGMPEALLAFVPSIPAAARPVIAGAPVPTTTQDLYSATSRSRHEQFSSELEISGDNSHMDWVVGGFYFWEKGVGNNPQTSAFVMDTNATFLSSMGPLGPLFAAANPARYRAVVTRAVLRYTSINDSKAIYGQTTVYPGGRDSPLSLTVGARYTWDDKKMIRYQNGAAPLAQVERGEDSFKRFTWNLMARYEITPDISAYGRIATGYRSGGFNASDRPLPGTTTLPGFKPETLTSYEVGMKSELFDRRVRLNIAGYYNEYKDLVVSIPVTNAPPGTFATRIGNAGKVTYTGIEAEVQASLTRNFSIDGSIGYVDVDTKSFLGGQSTTPGNPPVDIASIIKAAYTAPLTANVALNGRFPVGSDNAEIVMRVAYTHEDGYYNFINNLSSPFNEAVKTDARDIVNAQLSIEKLNLGQGTARAMLWVKNLTNAKDFARGIDFGPLGLAGGYYAEPRTYGLTLGFQY